LKYLLWIKARLKKTEFNNLSKAEQRRYESIVTIQKMLNDGFSATQVKDALHTTYFRVRRYARGDPLKLCGFNIERAPEASKYRVTVIDLLKQNVTKSYILQQVYKLGYTGKSTAFYAYCRKLITELGIDHSPIKNPAGVRLNPGRGKPKQRYVTKTELARHLWSGTSFNPADKEAIIGKYPLVSEIEQCILDFREIYAEKNVALLEQFIKKYSQSRSKPLSAFASGLLMDIEAVKNSIISDLSNGFVEGNVNKIKTVKRTMYGRAKIDLLRVKILFAR